MNSHGYITDLYFLCLFELPSFQELRPLGKKVEMKLCKQDISNSMTIELENSVQVSPDRTRWSGSTELIRVIGEARIKYLSHFFRTDQFLC